MSKLKAVFMILWQVFLAVFLGYTLLDLWIEGNTIYMLFGVMALGICLSIIITFYMEYLMEGLQK